MLPENISKHTTWNIHIHHKAHTSNTSTNERLLLFIDKYVAITQHFN